MKKLNLKTLGVKQICKEYAMTIPAARKALKSCRIMNEDGSPAKAEYAKAGLLEDGSVYYRWNAEVVREEFDKAGLAPNRLKSDCFVLNRYQAQEKLELAFFEMGNAVRLGSLDSPSDPETQWACGVHESSEFNDMHVLGGPASVLLVSDKSSCADFLERVREVSFRYKKACLTNASSKQQSDEINHQQQVIENICNWVMNLFFR